MPISRAFASLDAVQAIFDAIPTPIFLKDEKHRLALVNRAFAEVTGRQPEDLLSGDDTRFFNQEEVQRYQAADRRVFETGELYEYEESVTGPSGSTRVFLTRKQLLDLPLPDGQTERFLVAASADVTTIREAENRARRAEAERRAETRILETVARGVPLNEALATITQEVDRLWPEAMTSILLHNADQGTLHPAAAPRLPKSFLDRIDGLNVHPENGSCGSAVATGQQVVVTDTSVDPRWSQYRDLAAEHRLHACWSTPIFGSEGEPIGCFAIYYREPRSPEPEALAFLTRISHLAALAIERARQDESLRASEDRFRIVSQTTADLVVDWDLSTGEIWVASEGVKNVLGYCDGEAPRPVSAWLERVHPDDVPTLLERVRAITSGKVEVGTFEYRVARADGRWARLVFKGQLLKKPGGGDRLIASVVDVTEQRNLQEQLMRAQRMEAVGQLTGGVAHDFNNLLTAVIGSADALAAELEGRPDLQPLAELILEAAERGAGLVRQLLAFSRKQALAPEPVDCAKLLETVAQMARRTFSEEIEITTEVAEADLRCLADRTQLTSALLNLCINARDAMPAGGRLTIGVRREAPSAPGGPGEVALYVTDTGEGMTPEIKAMAMEPFFTTKPAGQGSGLGLSMVYGFVTQSGGRLEIDSEPGQGCTVRIGLPGTCSSPAASEPAWTQAAARKQHVLLVEDDPLVRAQAQRQLVGLGFEVSAAESGPEALEVLARRSDIDLLFTDVVMPGGMNGRQLADHARLLSPPLRVVFTSGHTEDAILAKARLDQSAVFLPKPYRRAEMARALEEALAHGR